MKYLKTIVLGLNMIFLFNVNALDLKGFDKFGYNQDGYDKHGYNFFGYNKEGFNKEGCNVFKYNNPKSLDCKVDKFAEEHKTNPEFIAYQLKRSKELLYKKG